MKAVIEEDNIVNIPSSLNKTTNMITVRSLGDIENVQKLTDYTFLELNEIVALRGSDTYGQQDVTILVEDIQLDSNETLEDVVIGYLQLGYTVIPF